MAKTKTESIIYFHDEAAEKEMSRETERTRTQAIKLMTAYERVTGFKIEAIPQLNELSENPREYYKAQYFQEHQHELGALSKLNLDVSELIKLPANFHEVENAASNVSKLSISSWTIENGTIVTTHAEQERIRNKVFCIASTADELRRLTICEKLISAFLDLEKEIETQFKPNQVKTILEGKTYIRKTLPYELRLTPSNEGLKLTANPTFIRDGYAGCQHLGPYLPTAKEIKQAQREDLGEKHIMFHRLYHGGERLLYQLLSEYKEQPTDRFVGFCNSLGQQWGTPIDLDKKFVRTETSYQPIR